MPANHYEGMFILDSNRYARDAAGMAEQINTLIESHGGKMLVSRLWEERRLAYPIKNHRKGTYWLTYFQLETNQLKDIDHQCLINESILRHLFLRVDPRLIDTLVEHAKSGHIRPEPAAAPRVAVVAAVGALDDEEEIEGEIEE